MKALAATGPDRGGLVTGVLPGWSPGRHDGPTTGIPEDLRPSA